MSPISAIDLSRRANSMTASSLSAHPRINYIVRVLAICNRILLADHRFIAGSPTHCSMGEEARCPFGKTILQGKLNVRFLGAQELIVPWMHRLYLQSSLGPLPRLSPTPTGDSRSPRVGTATSTLYSTPYITPCIGYRAHYRALVPLQLYSPSMHRTIHAPSFAISAIEL